MLRKFAPHRYHNAAVSIYTTAIALVFERRQKQQLWDHDGYTLQFMRMVSTWTKSTMSYFTGMNYSSPEYYTFSMFCASVSNAIS